MVKELGKADEDTKRCIKEEVKSFFKKNWEDLGDEFIDHSLFDSGWILLVRDSNNLVGLASIHKKQLEGKVFYNFKTDAVIPKLHSIGLLERMNQILFKYAYFDNLLVQKSLWIHLIFSTPNLRILGFFAKRSSHIYPNPYTFDVKHKSLPLPDDATWKYVKAYNKVDLPPNPPLSKEASVIDTSESQWPFNCYEKDGLPYYHDQQVNAFGDYYLRFKEGKRRMFVVCAHISPWDVIRYFTQYMVKLIKKNFTF